MPQLRSALGGAFLGLGDGLDGLIGRMTREQATQQSQAAIAAREQANQQSGERIALNKLLLEHPEYAASPADRLTEGVLGGIDKAKTGVDLGTDPQVYMDQLRSKGVQTFDPSAHIGQMDNPTDGTLPSANIQGQDTPQADRVMRAFNAKGASIAQADSENTTPVERYNPDGSKSTIYVPKAGLGALGPIQQSPTTAQSIANANQTISGTSGANAGAAGAKALAEEKAKLPFELQLAQTRANTSLLSAQALDDYKKSHPAATQQQINRASTAQTAIGQIDDLNQMLDEMNKRGMTGALMGRYNDLATGRVKSEAMFANPSDASLAANYFSSMKLLSSLAAVAHGGARGGGSEAMAKRFDSIINGVGDKSIIQGQLDSVKRLMQRYAQDPTSPPVDFPALSMPGGATQNPAVDPKALGKFQSNLQVLRGGGQ